MSEMILRPYQREAVTKIREAFSERRSVCYVLPTGGGKTVVLAEICRAALDRGTRVLILVHRSELLSQISSKLSSISLPHGLVSPRHRFLPEALVQVASVQSLVRRLEGFPEPRLIIVDECHHLSEGSAWGTTVSRFPGAKLLGVTATPTRLDGRGLGQFFEAMILGPSLRALTADGYLTPARYFAPLLAPGIDDMEVRMGDFVSREIEAVMNKPSITGDAIEHYRRLSDKKPALAFCTSVKHARDVAAEFRAAGYRAESVDGELDPQTRESRLDALALGKLHVLTNCQLITEGTDIAGVHTGIILRPTASLGLHLQILGRMLRLAPDKPIATILDHAGNCVRHGLADEEREWTLNAAKKRFKKTPETTIGSVTVCPSCYMAQLASPRCLECGHVFEVKARVIEVTKGELREIEARKAESLAIERKKEIYAAKSLSDLQAIAKRKGYNPRWAVEILKARGKKKR